MQILNTDDEQEARTVKARYQTLLTEMLEPAQPSQWLEQVVKR